MAESSGVVQLLIRTKDCWWLLLKAADIIKYLAPDAFVARERKSNHYVWQQRCEVQCVKATPNERRAHAATANGGLILFQQGRSIIHKQAKLSSVSFLSRAQKRSAYASFRQERQTPLARGRQRHFTCSS